MARPRIQIDEKQVEALAKIGCCGEEIAAVIGCSRDTIERRFAAVVKRGHDSRNASLRRAQYEVAVKQKNATMLIWLGKQFLGQRDNIDANVNLGGSIEIRETDEEGILAAADAIKCKRASLPSLEGPFDRLHALHDAELQTC